MSKDLFKVRGFPVGPVVKTPCFHCRGCRFDSIPGRRTEIRMPHSVAKKLKDSKNKNKTEAHFKMKKTSKDLFKVQDRL